MVRGRAKRKTIWNSGIAVSSVHSLGCSEVEDTSFELVCKLVSLYVKFFMNFLVWRRESECITL